jgi:hypothetical protein
VAAGGLAALNAASRPPPAAGDGSFIVGTANAVGEAVTLAPSTAGLGYDITLATSVADYQAGEGQAQAQTLNLGTIGLALTSTGCDGSAPPVQQSQLPQPAVAESSGPTESQNQSETPAGFPGGSGGGTEQAQANGQPASSATTRTADFTVPGLLSVSGAQSSAQTQVVAGATRQAEATADVSQLTLGTGVTAVTLSGLHWDATQQTGASPTATGTFSVAGISLAGHALPVGTDQLPATLNTVNTVLAQTGLHLSMPQAQQPGDGSVHETPLDIGIDNSELGRQLVGPGLGQAEPVTQAIANALLGVSCRFGTALLVGDIGIGAVAGGGGLDLDLGGATATTDGTAYANPFGSPSLGTGGAPPAQPPTVVTTPASSQTIDVPGSAGSLGTPGQPSSPGGSATAALPAAPTASRGICLSLAGGPCTRGDALLAGVVALAAVFSCAMADVSRLRRRTGVRKAVPS